MKGRNRFSADEAAEIRALLARVRVAAPGSRQTALRHRLRALDFYISDWRGHTSGFTAADFDALIASGLVSITPAPSASKSSAARAEAHELARSARVALRSPALYVEEARCGAVPDCAGLYALHGPSAVWRQLGLGECPDARPLFVGKAEHSLHSRDVDLHFTTGKTGWSSLRRSFAVLLADELRLVATRRPETAEPERWAPYGLEADGDQRLTDWMRASLRLAVWVSPPGSPLADVERAVVGGWLPPLNLAGVKTPWTAQIKARRAALAAQAEGWAGDRGHARPSGAARS